MWGCRWFTAALTVTTYANVAINTTYTGNVYSNLIWHSDKQGVSFPVWNMKLYTNLRTGTTWVFRTANTSFEKLDKDEIFLYSCHNGELFKIKADDALFCSWSAVDVPPLCLERAGMSKKCLKWAKQHLQIALNCPKTQRLFILCHKRPSKKAANPRIEEAATANVALDLLTQSNVFWKQIAATHTVSVWECVGG